MFWRNGQLNRLQPAGFVSTAYSVCTWDRHVYVGGEALINGVFTAVYWQDGREVALSPGTVFDITVNEAGIFAAGTTSEKTKDNYDISFPAIWKNGVMTKLPSLGLNVFVNALTLHQQDVYVAGSLRTLSEVAITTNAVYWKNGTLVVLEEQKNSIGSEARQIAISGKDLYVAGHYDHSAAYWVNGKRYDLLPNVRSYVQAIYVRGNEILMVGCVLKSPTESQVVYWKINKNPVELTVANGSASMPRSGFDFYNASTYISGIMKENIKGTFSIPVYWKNKTMVRLPVDSSGWATDIAVMPVK